MRVNDSKKRRNEILAATVEQYLSSAQPVGSALLCKSGKFSCSSATIRNVLAELEELGYLTHPHTSAGRIPTDKGYRYYLDFIVKKSQLTNDERKFIDQVWQHRVKRLNDLMEEASKIVSELTHYAGMVHFHDPEERFSFSGIANILDQPEFNDVLKARALFSLLEEREKILDLIDQEFDDEIKIYIGEESKFYDIKDCSIVISKIGKKRKTDGRLAVLGPKRMAYRKVIPLIEYLSDLIDEI